MASANSAESTSAPPQEDLELSKGPIVLSDALALALEHNPRLSVFDLDIRVAEAKALQASLRPNPELGLDIENFAGSGEFSGFGSSEVTLSLSQLFELGGKRPKRQEVARLDSELATWDYESARLEVFNDVTQAFIAVVIAQTQIALANDLIEVSEQDLAAVNRRVDAGATPPIERIRARIALATANMERKNTALALVAARAELAATWGSKVASFSNALGDLREIAPPPELGELDQRLKSNPDIARWKTKLAQRQASLELERALGKIDLTAGGGIRRIEGSGDNAFVVGLAVPIQFKNPNKGIIQAAEIQLHQIDKEHLSVLVSTNAKLASLLAELTAAYHSAYALSNEILPEAREAMTTAEGAYLKGLFSFTDVLAVRKTNFELHGRYIEALARYHSAAANIERLVAGKLSGDEQEQEKQ
jgi:cobalt-zinc-cadmium efflux system outer membrane protein